jgi:outer membrane protein assembly factor BamB
MSRAIPALALLTAFLALPIAAPAADWPQYRGPRLDGTSSETGLARQWPADGPETLWRHDLGDGYSGMAVVDGRLYTMYGSGGDEMLVCLDAATGREIWRLRTDDNRADGQGGGPRATPTVHGSTVYAVGAQGKLYAVEAVSGEKVWWTDLVQAFGAGVPTWGVAASPIVVGELLLLDVGGRSGYSIVAFDSTTGTVVWHAESDKAGYSTPLPVTVDGIRQALFFTATQLVSVSPADGRTFWRQPWETSYDVNAAMPVFLPPDRVFISSSYDRGALVLTMRRDGDGVAISEAWRSRDMKNHFNSSVYLDGHLYGFDDGTLKCLDAATGEERWAQRGFAKGSLLAADGHLVVLSERGVLALVEATPSAYVERARAQVLDGKTWTMPTLSDGVLYVRDQQEIKALKIAA